MIHRTDEEEVKEYFGRTDAINQSSLKYILENGMESFLNQAIMLAATEDLPYYEEKSWQILGNGVDCRMTFGDDVFHRNYYFSDLLKKPGPTVMSVLKRAYDSLLVRDAQVSTIENHIFDIWAACNGEEYYMNRAKATPQEDTRVVGNAKTGTVGIIQEAINHTYWEDLRKAGKRQILSDNQNIIIDTITESFRTHRFTEKIIMDAKHLDLIYQKPLYFYVDGVLCKALPDLLIINHSAKKIIPIDFKTLSGYVSKFNKSVKKRRYDIQGAFYREAIEQNLETISKLIEKDITSGYIQTRFAFMVESTTKPGTPMIFPLTEDLLLVGKQGDGKELLGYTQAVAIYDEWKKNSFSLEEIVGKNNGVVFVGQDFEYNIDL
jgi:hypothetical protein